MEREQVPAIGSVTLVLLAVAVGVWILRARDDVAVCRQTLTGLAQGRSAVERHIAWDRLTAVGVDVGTTYRQLPDERERTAYRRAFIERFAAGFQGTKGDVGAFRRWRVAERSSHEVVIAADNAALGKTLLFRVARPGRMIEAIQWQ